MDTAEDREQRLAIQMAAIQRNFTTAIHVGEHDNPVDLESAVWSMAQHMTAEGEEYIRAAPDCQSALSHMGQGMHLRNTWKLWEPTTPLHAWFVERGVHHPDDMSSMVLNAFYARVMNLTFDFDARVKEIRAFYEKYE
jgi:hypothetical protein